MYHHMEFDRHLIRERNQQIFRVVQALRLDKRLRRNHRMRGLRLVALTLRLKSMSQLLRRVALAGR